MFMEKKENVACLWILAMDHHSIQQAQMAKISSGKKTQKSKNNNNKKGTYGLWIFPASAEEATAFVQPLLHQLIAALQQPQVVA
jgi:hypothetical protein